MPWSLNSGSINQEVLSYRELFDLVPFPLILLQSDSPIFTILAVNDKYLEITDTKREKILGTSFFDLYKMTNHQAHADRTGIVQHFEQLIKTRVPELHRTFRWDVPVKETGTSQVKYWKMVITPVFSPSGEVLQILNAPVDVTETVFLKKTAHKAKQETESQKKLLQDIFLQAPFGVGIYRGADFVVELVNPALADFLGHDYRELLGKPFFEVVDEAAEMGWEKIIHQVLYTNEPFIGFEYPVRLLRNGKIENRNCTFIVYPFFETEGKTSGVIKVSVDVTEYVQVKQTLLENEERLNIAVESANLSVWDLDLKTNVVLTRKAMDLPGLPGAGESWSLKKYVELLTPEGQDGFLDAVADAQRTGSLEVMVEAHLVDGTIHWLQSVGRVHPDETGNPARIIGITQDVTSSVELDRRKNDLIATISHELKTPVTSINAIAQVLEKRFASSDDVLTGTMLNKMVTQLNRLTALIHDLLDVSRIEGGKMRLRKTNFLFYDLIEDTVSDIQRTTTSHEIVIEGEKLIPCHSDRERLGQVLTNLITNAIKYSPGTSRVTIYADRSPREVICCVTDFGIGIEKDKQPYVFDRFFRVMEERNYAFQGIGLGLYISAEIIKRLDGRIWLESEPNKGSTFCFAVPVVQ